jgi:hypothetical protein
VGRGGGNIKSPEQGTNVAMRQVLFDKVDFLKHERFHALVKLNTVLCPFLSRGHTVFKNFDHSQFQKTGLVRFVDNCP